MRTTRIRVEAALAPTVVAARWMRSPAGARAAVRTLSALRERAAHEAVPIEELAEAAERAARLGQYDLAEDLYTRAIDAGGAVRALVRARRRLPGYSGAVAPETVRQAIDAAFGYAADGGQPIVERRVTTFATGRGLGVDVVARHHFTDGRTMVRKSFLGEAPRELHAYRAGLLGSTTSGGGHRSCTSRRATATAAGICSSRTSERSLGPGRPRR